MKNMKKLASLLLALVMILALAVPALAADDGSITISNGVAGQTYNAYRIFDLTYGGTTDGNKNAPHAYTVAEKWTTFFAEGAAGREYVNIDPATGIVTWKKDANNQDMDPKAFAEAALAFATAEATKIEPDETKDAATGDPATDKNDYEVKFTGLPLGYYLIDSSLGSLCTLDSTNKNVTVTEKNERPTHTKDIPDPSGLKVGDAVEYRVVVNAKRGAINYKVTDTMTNLTFNSDSLKVQHKNAEGTLVDYPSDKYTLTSAESSFTLEFDNEYLKSLTDGLAVGASHDIIVTYTGTITPAALVEDKINNTATLNFGDKGTPDSDEPTPVETPLYDFDVVKVNSDSWLLAGAVLQVMEAAKNDAGETVPGDVINLVYVADGNYYRPAVPGETGTVDRITTTADAKISFRGFGAGDYYINEVTAPDGYNKLAEPWMFTVLADNYATLTPVEEVTDTEGNVTTPTHTTAANGVQVLNLTGAELPSTGGIGTTLFYIVGGLLIVGAAVLLITKKRVNGEQ